MPTEFFCTVTPKNLTGKPDTPFLSIKLFETGNFLKNSRIPLRNWLLWEIPEISETLKGSPTKFSGTVRQNYFDGKLWYPPPLLSVIFFDTKIFLKHRRVPPRSFSVLWDKNFWRKIVILPAPLLCIKFFDTRIFLKHRRVPLRNFPALWDKKTFNGKSWYPHLLHKL